MNSDLARKLLTGERARIEQAIAGLERDGSLESADRREPGDGGTQDLYQDEFNQGRSEQLRKQLAALERAEARLAAGTYGLSIESGDSIPDRRLEAVPTAERTVEEEERYQRG
jgi:DnaK suppressor protein